MRTRPGSSYPLGATWDGAGVNFALLDPYAKAVDTTVRWSDTLYGYPIGDADADLARDDRTGPTRTRAASGCDWPGTRSPRSTRGGTGSWTTAS